jgi:hypothetical protein
MSNELNHAVILTRGTGDIIEEQMCMELASVVGKYLHEVYPGYLWRVNADIRGGIVNILCHDISTEKGCTLYVKDLVDPEPARKLVHQAGGEMLERAKLHRGRMIEDEVATASRDFKGNIKNLD